MATAEDENRSGAYSARIRFLDYDKHLKPSTARFYRDCLSSALRYQSFAELPLSQWTAEVATRYVKKRQAEPSAPSINRLNAELRTLRRLLHVAAEWNVIPFAPVIHTVKGGNKRTRVVDYEEEARYLNAANPNLRDAAILALDTGLRPNSELFLLQWENVHLEQKAAKGWIHVEKGKTDSATRNVPLTPRAYAVLLRRQQLSTSKYVFPGWGTNRPLTTFQHAHHRAIKLAGLTRFEFYTFRHTFATRAAASGMTRAAVARLMGHSSPTTAEKYYEHVPDQHVVDEFERFTVRQAEEMTKAFPEKTDSVQ